MAPLASREVSVLVQAPYWLLPPSLKLYRLDEVVTKERVEYVEQPLSLSWLDVGDGTSVLALDGGGRQSFRWFSRHQWHRQDRKAAA